MKEERGRQVSHERGKQAGGGRKEGNKERRGEEKKREGNISTGE